MNTLLVDSVFELICQHIINCMGSSSTNRHTLDNLSTISNGCEIMFIVDEDLDIFLHAPTFGAYELLAVKLGSKGTEDEIFYKNLHSIFDSQEIELENMYFTDPQRKAFKELMLRLVDADAL